MWQLLSIRLMCFIIWSCHLIWDFTLWIFLGVQFFCRETPWCNSKWDYPGKRKLNSSIFLGKWWKLQCNANFLMLEFKIGHDLNITCLLKATYNSSCLHQLEILVYLFVIFCVFSTRISIKAHLLFLIQTSAV